ncbi:Succinylglutamate desuccinylase/aspartoacylase [[Leptolyngbya] sp. PCC 7376]|uniref:succinylglutamate desuccinylase/aspartoacylase domain-containing protein n=1 Tax=[Leptolyngbya] sp. PCC 7376 TaxID=111781 RepID=UPI00029F2D56|nr:succinylglutamate desuccinylase/aspartoacylase family protein [[Leptolyngbya] sp. PCC 7376]AFY37813.1 Succinylglutamate desuccinylase/aspartoacylase [[Leptolyngbya] sp. PCC 7376]
MIPSIETIDLFQLASGDRLAIQVYKFVGAQPGAKVYIQANLHGCEIVGNAVVHQLIEYLSDVDKGAIAGEIWLVPTCNPLGTNQRGHFYATGGFHSYSGEDWNRIFWEYEPTVDELSQFVDKHLGSDEAEIIQAYRGQILAAFEKELAKQNHPCGVSVPEYFRGKLQCLCLDADYVIDIHSSSNDGLDFVYYFPNRETQASWFNFDYSILLTQGGDYAFDEAFIWPWIVLEKAFAETGQKIKLAVDGCTLELGSGMKMRPSSVAKGLASIKNYLAHRGILSAEIPEATTTKCLPSGNITRYRATVGGMIGDRLPLGQAVKAGEKLYDILSFNRQGKLPKVTTINSMVDGIVFDLAISESANQGEYVMSVLETN